MSDPAHLRNIRAQFTRQAEAYVRMKQTTDERGLDALVQLSGVAPHHRVLDVACGPGFLTMTFARHCAAAVGIDATEEMLSRARAEAAHRGLHNVEFRAGDAEHLPFNRGRFDVVSCRAAFHHFPRPERVVAEMSRVITTAGRVVIADMLASEDADKAAYHNRVERLCDPTHVRALPESAFERLFAEAGLEVLLRPRTTLDYDLDEWIEHGGPDAGAVQEIKALMAESVAVDRTGLQVRMEDGRLRFSHTGVAFVLTPAASAPCSP